MNKANTGGALPSQTISQMIEAGHIAGADSDNIQPASLDLVLSDELYEVEGIFQPRADETIRDVLGLISHEKRSFDQPLEKGKAYLARLSEALDLPSSIYGYCNPKSTTGRLDVHVRVLADGVSRYDSISPRGYRGELWLLIIPNSFAIKANSGQTLAQLRLFNADTRFDEFELELAMSRRELIWQGQQDELLSHEKMRANDGDGYAILTLGLETPVVGYRAIETGETIDLSKVGEHESEDFFEPIFKEDLSAEKLSLTRGNFYILSTAERVRIPPELACEMMPMDERSGEFRSHYAGFLDPGWGYGQDGEECGRPFTLEVRPFEDLIVRHGQPAAKIRFEHMSETPETSYEALAPNYHRQTGASGPKLAKQFLSK